MSLGFIVIAAWALAAFAGAFFVVRRLDQRFPAASSGSRRQLVWYVFAAIIILPAIYVLFDGAFDGQMALPSKRSPTHYVYLESQPVAFWTVLSVYFLMTASTAAVLAGAAYVVLRPSRVMA